MPSIPKPSILLVIAGCVIGTAATTSATPIYYVTYSAEADTSAADDSGLQTSHVLNCPGCPGGPLLLQRNSIDGSASTNSAGTVNEIVGTGPDEETTLQFDQTGVATAIAHATLGDLGATATAHAFVSPDAYVINGNQFLNDFQGQGTATAFAGWGDTLSFVSDTVPAGTAASFLLTLTLQDAISGPGNGSITTGLSIGGTGLSLQDNGAAHSSSTQTATAILTASVGGSLFVSGYLSMSAQATAAGNSPDVDNEDDAGDTSLFTITSLTPGVGYTTASDVRYDPAPVAAVPEPATLTLTGLGLAGGISRLRRRRSRAEA